MSQENLQKESYYCFSSDRICSVVDTPTDKGTEEEKFQDYQCYICYDLSLNIQECKSCERIFCNNCIEAIKKKKHDESTQCPNNCKVWNLDKPHRSIKNFIENIEFYCKNVDLGCRHKLKVANAKQHEQFECDYNMVKCENVGCHEEVSVKNQKRHQEMECLYRIIKCSKCELEFLFHENSEHDCVVSLKKEVASLKDKISTMYTKDQLDKLLEEYLQGIKKDGQSSHLSKNSQEMGYDYPQEELLNEQESNKQQSNLREEQEEQKVQDGQRKSSHKKEELDVNPFVKMYEKGLKIIQEQQQQQQQNIPFYPPHESTYPPHEISYPPHQSQIFNDRNNLNQSSFQQQPYQDNANQSYYPPQSVYNQYNTNIPTYPPPQSHLQSTQIYPPPPPPYIHQSHHQSNYHQQSHQGLPGCNHSFLQLIYTVNPLNKNCSCGKMIDHEYYYCQNCAKYFCLNCRQQQY